MPRASKSFNDQSLLEAALEGLQLQKQRIEEQIRHVRSRLGKGLRNTARSVKAGRKRVLSEAARKRIAAAQKRRWAEYRKSSEKG